MHSDDSDSRGAGGPRSCARRGWPTASTVPTSHQRHAAKTLEMASFLYALIELLKPRSGVVAIEELDERKRRSRSRLSQAQYGKARSSG